MYGIKSQYPIAFIVVIEFGDQVSKGLPGVACIIFPLGIACRVGVRIVRVKVMNVQEERIGRFGIQLRAEFIGDPVRIAILGENERNFGEFLEALIETGYLSDAGISKNGRCVPAGSTEQFRKSIFISGKWEGCETLNSMLAGKLPCEECIAFAMCCSRAPDVNRTSVISYRSSIISNLYNECYMIRDLFRQHHDPHKIIAYIDHPIGKAILKLYHI